MKTLITLIVLFFAFTSATNTPVVEKFEGTYNGLTEESEYQFTDKDGEVHFFYDLSENVEYDLSEEEYVGQKFMVTWTTKTVDQYDVNEELVEVEVKIITALKKL